MDAAVGVLEEGAAMAAGPASSARRSSGLAAASRYSKSCRTRP
ncbi:hypothetical protein ACFQ60_07120 [Streptomyces zhihengii]